MDDDVIRAWTAEERRRIARDLRIISDAAWDLPSLCGAWRCRDVLAHLVWLAESSRPRVVFDVAKTFRPPRRAIGRIARKLGDSDPSSLLERLDAAAEGRFVLPGAGPQVALAEVLTHRADIHLVADDAGFEVGPSDGPEVRGPGTSLLLALAGRPNVRSELRGAVEVFG